MSNNLQTTFLAFKHEEKEWNKIILVSKYVVSNNLQANPF